MTPVIGELLDKARDCLACARIILSAGVGEDAGRDACLAGFHAAQALIRTRSGRTAKTHRGALRLLSQLARKEPELAYLTLFRSQAYNLKAVADYELGPSAGVLLDRASLGDRPGSTIHRPNCRVARIGGPYTLCRVRSRRSRAG